MAAAERGSERATWKGSLIISHRGSFTHSLSCAMSLFYADLVEIENISIFFPRLNRKKWEPSKRASHFNKDRIYLFNDDKICQ